MIEIKPTAEEAKKLVAKSDKSIQSFILLAGKEIRKVAERGETQINLYPPLEMAPHAHGDTQITPALERVRAILQEGGYSVGIKERSYIPSGLDGELQRVYAAYLEVSWA